jgi:hypothetical protein
MKTLLIILFVLALLYSGAIEKADEAFNEAFGLNERPWLKWLVIGAAILAVWIWF